MAFPLFTGSNANLIHPSLSVSSLCCVFTKLYCMSLFPHHPCLLFTSISLSSSSSAACGCQSEFTDSTCEDLTGRCFCKPNYTGENCDSCASGFINFPECYRKLQLSVRQTKRLNDHLLNWLRHSCLYGYLTWYLNWGPPLPNLWTFPLDFKKPVGVCSSILMLLLQLPLNHWTLFTTVLFKS